jgi:hypothetical protein
VRRSRLASATLLCLAAGCSRAPLWYAPPVQEKPLTGIEPLRRLGDFMSMRDPNAADYILSQNSRRTEFRFLIGPADHLHVAVDFSIPGPMTVEVFVNGDLAGKYSGTKPGTFRINEPVSRQLLVPDAENRVVVTSDSDGILISRVGFIH